LFAIGAAFECRARLVGRRAREQHRSGPTVEQLGDDRSALFGCLAWSIHRLGPALAQRSVMIDLGEAEVRIRQAAKRGDGVVR
jgi:hypothetical protein